MNAQLSKSNLHIDTTKVVDLENEYEYLLEQYNRVINDNNVPEVDEVYKNKDNENISYIGMKLGLSGGKYC